MKTYLVKLANLLVMLLPDTRCFKLKRSIYNFAGLDLKDNVEIHSHARFQNQHLSIDQGTWVGGWTLFIGSANAPIVIGKNVDIAPRCLLVTGSHEVGSNERRAGDGITNKIEIGNGTWIGAGTTIIAGVRIGDGCIIGAGAVVTESIPNNCLAAGVPAKVIRQLSN